MKPEWRRYASLGLFLALAAALVTGGLYFVQRELNLYVQIGLALVLFGLALFAFLDPERVRQVFTGRQARYGSNALVMSIAFIGILVVVNYLAYGNAQRWDLTEDKQYTLAPETVSALKSMEQPVHAMAFFNSSLDPSTTEKLLDQFKFHSDGKFTFEFIDPDLDQVQAYESGITRNGSVVLYRGDQKQIVSTATETELTSGLVRLISPNARMIYFLTGHGEMTPEISGQIGMEFAARDLGAKNYTLNSLNLIANNSIPADASLIIIAAPQQALSGAEVELLKNYLDAGGSLVYLPDPVHLTQLGQANSELDTYLAESWGIDLRDDMIIDLTTSVNSYEFAIGVDYGAHAITEQLAGTVVVLPTARSVRVSEAPGGVSQVTLVSTSPNSWSETDLAGLTTEGADIMWDENSDDLAGPIPLAVAAENFQTQGRVLVVGDATFLTDDYYTAYSNSNFFVNAVDWTAGAEETINILPRDRTSRILVPPQAWILNLITLGSVFILPGLIVVSGIVVWFQRRRRG